MTPALELPWQELPGNLRAFIGRRVHNQADVMGLGSLREAQRLHAWVYRVARNVIVDHYRSPAVRRERASGDTLELASANESVGFVPVEEDEGSALRELATCLLPMMRQLSLPYQDAIRMADLEGLTHGEAAGLAGVSVSGMKSRVQRARRQLRAIVEDCCRVDLDRRGSITSFEPRRRDRCGRDDCQ